MLYYIVAYCRAGACQQVRRRDHRHRPEQGQRNSSNDDSTPSPPI